MFTQVRRPAMATRRSHSVGRCYGCEQAQCCVDNGCPTCAGPIWPLVDQIVKSADITLRPFSGSRVDPDKCFPFHWLKHPEFIGFAAFVGGDDRLCWGAEDNHSSLFEVRANALVSCIIYADKNDLNFRRC